MTVSTTARARHARPGRGPANALLSLADALSLSRIALAGALWLVEPKPLPMLLLMSAAAFSDVLDGRLARRARRGALAPPGGGRGAWLDPLCDKVFVLSLVARATFALGLPSWFVALVGTRELLIFAALAAHAVFGGSNARRIEFTASGLGKATTVLQFLALGLPLTQGRLTPPALAAAVASAAVGALAVAGYVVRARAERSA
jgi:cardiolipin synthase (CMP-forming)